MTTQLRHHLPPADAQIVNTRLAIYRDGDRVVYFAHGGPMLAHHVGDQAGARIALAEATSLGLAKPKELAEAVGVHRSTLHRNVQKLEEGGVVAVIGERSGPKGPHKLTPDRLAEAQRWLDEGLSIAEVGRRLGVSDAAIHHTLNRRRLRPGAVAPAPAHPRLRHRWRCPPPDGFEEPPHSGGAVSRHSGAEVTPGGGHGHRDRMGYPAPGRARRSVAPSPGSSALEQDRTAPVGNSMLYRIVEVEARPEYRVWVRFEDGVEGEVDLSALAGKGVFGSWKDRAEFEKVSIDEESGTLTWPGGIDLAPDALYGDVAGVAVSPDRRD